MACETGKEFHCICRDEGKCWKEGHAQCEYCVWVHSVNTGPLTKEQAEAMTKRAM